MYDEAVRVPPHVGRVHPQVGHVELEGAVEVVHLNKEGKEGMNH